MISINTSQATHWQKAVSFAARSHIGQMRKDGKTPYVAHPFRAAFTVRHVFEENEPVALCTALLRDVIEDVTVDYDELEEQFGMEIARAVAETETGQFLILTYG